MAQNFKISIHRTRKDLLVGLSGDFDGSSALELIHVLSRNGTDSRNILVNTSGVGMIHPFGREVLLRNSFRLNGLRPRIRFVGNRKERLRVKGGPHL